MSRTQPLDTLVDAGAGELDGEVTPRSTDPLRARIQEVIAGRYRLVELIGHGGSGAVYGATDLKDTGNKRVAVKLLHRHLRSAAGHTARFHREIHALQQTAHSAVVRIFDSGCDDQGQLYLVMEWLEGELLIDRMLLPLKLVDGEARGLRDGLAERYRAGA